MQNPLFALNDYLPTPVAPLHPIHPYYSNDSSGITSLTPNGYLNYTPIIPYSFNNQMNTLQERVENLSKAQNLEGNLLTNITKGAPVSPKAKYFDQAIGVANVKGKILVQKYEN